MLDSKTQWRVVRVEYGDTLQRLAFRVLQDASRWPEIVWLNDLHPPYLTGDTNHIGLTTGRVLLYGSPIKVPSSAVSSQSGVSPEKAFGIDVLLTNGRMVADESGGLSLASGIPNLVQSLNHRLTNELGSLWFHPRYGNMAHRLKGRKTDFNIALLALRFCEETVLRDPRVKSVEDGKASMKGDAIVVALTAVVSDGSALPLQVEIQG